MKKWARSIYQPNLPLKNGKYVTASKEHIALSKKAAAEGMVLLKNQDGILPLKEGTKVALFGKGSFDYVKGGGGSGDVNTLYVRNLYEGLQKVDCGISIYEPLAGFYRNYVELQYALGFAAGMVQEPMLPEELIGGARAFTDTALIVISRFSGEGWDRSSVEYQGEYSPWPDEQSMPKLSAQIFPDGDFYLTDEEKDMIEIACENFDKVAVVLNIGGVIDTAWIRDDERIGAALVAWQGGMEGGLAAAEILCGKVNPSGKLADTFAERVEDYPSTENFHESVDYVDYTDDIYVGYRYFETIPYAAERVVYPFGFGLSYTDFVISLINIDEVDGEICAAAEVVNMGKRAGREVVQLYYGAPQGKLKKPARQLGAFVKTRELLPGEVQIVSLKLSVDAMASYDDTGKIQKSAYVLEEGEYHFYVGNSVRCEDSGFVLNLSESVVTEQLSARMVPTSLKKRMLSDGSFEELEQLPANDMNACIFEKMEPGTEEGIAPEVVARKRVLLLHLEKQGAIMFSEVAEGKHSMDEFMAQLDDDELLHILGGQPNTGVANTFGFGNLPKFGVPNVMTADGPAGLRVTEETGVRTTAWPCSTMIACSWDEELAEAVGKAAAEEVKENNIAVWLTPAVCIHRNPLCGRNFEYYSEDPLLAGKIGAAAVRGIQSQGVAATVKHFAANNKETNRKHSDSRVSERALREIYLKVFEIIVKEADPWVIMSSYNAINGHRASENREMLEDILRGEWGFNGVVTTDWWTRGEHYKEIKAGNDIKMATGFPNRVKRAMELGALTREDLERCARRVLELLLKLN